MSQKRDVIATNEAPGAVGPYSQAIAIDGLVFTAGQIPVNPATGTIEAETIEDQTRQVLSNVDAVLRAAGSGLHRVVKMTVFMTDLGDFQAMNGVYAEFFPSEPPARSAVQVVALPLGVQIEMEAVALTRRILNFEF
jgi:2-iminobutanoate/2-iminopropanoate deaminase